MISKQSHVFALGNNNDLPDTTCSISVKVELELSHVIDDDLESWV